MLTLPDASYWPFSARKRVSSPLSGGSGCRWCSSRTCRLRCCIAHSAAGTWWFALHTRPSSAKTILCDPRSHLAATATNRCTVRPRLRQCREPSRPSPQNKRCTCHSVLGWQTDTPWQAGRCSTLSSSIGSNQFQGRQSLSTDRNRLRQRSDTWTGSWCLSRNRRLAPLCLDCPLRLRWTGIDKAGWHA